MNGTPRQAILSSQNHHLRRTLTKDWRVFPQDRSPQVPLTLWAPLFAVFSVTALIGLSLTLQSPLPPRNMKAQDFIAFPQFSVGATVEVREDGTVHSAPGINPLAEDTGIALNTGVVLNRLLQQGRWIYHIRFVRGLTGWVFEPDLVAGSRRPSTTRPDDPDKHDPAASRASETT